MVTEDFDIDSLARYLHQSSQKVAKLAERGKIPGRKVGGKWRFNPAEIYHWLEVRIGDCDEEALVEMEGVLQNSPGQQALDAISLVDQLPLEAVAVPLLAKTKSSVISGMVELAASTGWLWDPVKMADAIRLREDMQSTALENGVAFLHPRRPMPSILGESFLALGMTDRGIPFGGGRGVLTNTFFLICSVDDKQHLRILARLSRLIGNSDFLPALRTANDPQEAHRTVDLWEREL